MHQTSKGLISKDFSSQELPVFILIFHAFWRTDIKQAQRELQGSKVMLLSSSPSVKLYV